LTAQAHTTEFLLILKQAGGVHVVKSSDASLFSVSNFSKDAIENSRVVLKQAGGVHVVKGGNATFFSVSNFSKNSNKNFILL